MVPFDLRRRLAAEFIGTWLLVATVVGSGVMAEQLADGNAAVALLGNTAATGAILFVLITAFAPISGAHFNPAVSLVFLLLRELPPTLFILYVLVQLAGAIAGTITAHAMFELPLVQTSQHAREGAGQFLAEAIATFGLILTILGCRRFRETAIPAAVGCYIAAGYWFTASTSFANPAVTVARSLTDTFSGIRPVDAPWFILAEFVGALIALVLMRWLLSDVMPARQTVPAASQLSKEAPSPTGH
jgi:glycerol uptake facilitator-like aquaporin